MNQTRTLGTRAAEWWAAYRAAELAGTVPPMVRMPRWCAECRCYHVPGRHAASGKAA